MSESVEAREPVVIGGCLCGAVSYTISGELDNIIACHCEQCRKTSGHFVAATRVNDDCLKIKDNGSLAWYQSSENAKRGFCTRCGGNLFWKNASRQTTSIMAGTLDLPTNLKLTHHIYVAQASDYVSFKDDDILYDQYE